MVVRNVSLFVAGVLACVTSVTTVADSLLEVARLARAGANELALAQIDRLQPPYDQQPVEWLRWEEERFYILQSREDWSAVTRRVKDIPEDTPRSFRNKVLTLAADASLEQGDVSAARSGYRSLLWQDAPVQVGEREHRRWREGIIKTYLAEALLEDAETAIRRFRFDYPDHNEQTLVWMAEVLVQQGRYVEALGLGDQVVDHNIQALIALAKLRVEADEAESLVRRASALLTANEKTHYEQWVIFAEAAALQQNYRLQIECIEQAIKVKPYSVSAAFQLSGRQLWDAYLKYGRAYGNQQQLLIGDDEAWYFAASESVDKDPILARALFAVLAFESVDAKRQQLAHEYLVSMIEEVTRDGALLGYLYSGNPHFPAVDDIPLSARYRLVDRALSRGDIGQASELMQALEAPPMADAQWSWQLRRARVLILGDASTQGVKILRTLTAEPIEDLSVVDALIQVVFDLQKIALHRDALEIFWRVQAMPLDNKRRRELFFWMAESLSALDDFDSAARAYLESAILESEHAMDPWAQTARYHAAKSLAAAGYREDAQTLLKQLLRATKDADRRAVLRQELIQLSGHE